MDFFSSSSSFQDEFMHEDMPFWDFSMEHFDVDMIDPYLLSTPLEEEPQIVSRSAFVKYERSIGEFSTECSSSRASSEKNIHRRVINLLRRIPRAQTENQTGEFSPVFRHMMRERHRREKLRQNYANLHSMLPYRSKGDKNSIVQSTMAYVKELQGVKEELLRRNEELKLRNAKKSNLEGAKIKIRMANSASTLDSMIGALRNLKAMDVKAMGIQTDISGHELATIISIEKKIRTDEVEGAVEYALTGKVTNSVFRNNSASLKNS